MAIKKPETFVEKLKELQRQYISLEYRLNKLIEENTKEKQQSLHEMISARKAAEILHCTARNVPRIAEREHVFTLVHGNRKLYKKSQIEELANLR